MAVAVLDNDTRTEACWWSGSPIVASSVRITTAPAHGHAVVDPPDGTITYTAAAGFAGSDTFHYAFVDAGGNMSRSGLVTIQINRPVAGEDWTDTDAGNPVKIDVLENDSDPDGKSEIEQPGSVTIITQPAHGTASADPTTNEVTYTPGTGFGGPDSFLYTVTDAAGAISAPATVFVRVNRPTANDDFPNFSGTTPLAIDVLENDRPDGKDKIEQPGSVWPDAAAHALRLSMEAQTKSLTQPRRASLALTHSHTRSRWPGPLPPGHVTVVGSRPERMTTLRYRWREPGADQRVGERYGSSG